MRTLGDRRPRDFVKARLGSRTHMHLLPNGGCNQLEALILFAGRTRSRDAGETALMPRLDCPTTGCGALGLSVRKSSGRAMETPVGPTIVHVAKRKVRRNCNARL